MPGKTGEQFIDIEATRVYNIDDRQRISKRVPGRRDRAKGAG
jgi:hypothetical protein